MTEIERQPAKRTRWIGWSFVAAQFALLAVIIFVPNDTGRSVLEWSVPAYLESVLTWMTWIGIAIMVVAAVGLGRGLTATPVPNDHARLQTGGLFRFVRHPIYSGLLLFVIGHVSRSGSPVILLAGLALILLINVKARWEEVQLRERFADYSAYADQTPRFVPGVVRLR